MSVRGRGKRSSKSVEEEQEEKEEEEEVEQIEIDRVGKEEENLSLKLRAEEQWMRRCDVITINGGIDFLQKVSTDV